MLREGRISKNQLRLGKKYGCVTDALVIRPPEPLNIGHMENNPDELERVYQIGRNEAGKRLSEIKEWLTE